MTKIRVQIKWIIKKHNTLVRHGVTLGWYNIHPDKSDGVEFDQPIQCGKGETLSYIISTIDNITTIIPGDSHEDPFSPSKDKESQ